MFNSGDILESTYEVIGSIGSGGGSDIYKAEHLRMKKSVAIKRIKNNVKEIIENRAEVDILKNLKMIICLRYMTLLLMVMTFIL